MRYWHSGINSRSYFELLQAAGARHLLVDPTDLKHIPLDWKGWLTIDSGWYRAYRAGKNPPGVEEMAALALKRSHQLAYVVAPKGESVEASYHLAVQLQERLAASGMSGVGVICDFNWQQMGTPDAWEWVRQYEGIVGIGGAARQLHFKQKPLADYLEAICNYCPHKLHIFGCNWEYCLNLWGIRVNGFSGDSSKWLDGARYGTVAHIENGYLQFVKPYTYPQYRHLATPKGATVEQKKTLKYARLFHNVQVLEWLFNRAVAAVG